MNLQSLVKKHVEWKITIPFNNLTTVKSSEFFIKGSEWRLEMRFQTLESGYFNYKIYLCKINKEKNKYERLESGSQDQAYEPEERLEESFDVITFIKRKNYELFDRYSTSVWYSKQQIAFYHSTTVIKAVASLFSEGTLEVFCIFKLPASDLMDNPSFPMTADKCIQTHLDEPYDLESLSLDLSNLLRNEASPSDIVVKCGDCSNHAHRAMLAARSEVFAAMFRNKMAESENGVVEITDMDEADFELFLKFVYSGKIQIPSEDSATCLYIAGDKYAILSLKKVCSDYLVQNLNLKNCLRFLVMSERHGDEAFMGASLNFVAENLEGLDREEWSSFSSEFSKLAMNVYETRFRATLSKQVSHKRN